MNSKSKSKKNKQNIINFYQMKTIKTKMKFQEKRFER